MENKGRRILSGIITVVIILVYAFLRFQRYQARHEHQKADSVKDKKSTTESEELKNAEMNKAIEGGYSVVKKNDKFYIVKDNDFSTATELIGVTEALVIPTKDETKNKEYNLLVLKKDGEYRIVDETKGGKDILVLTGETITESTTFTVKDKTVYIN